MPTWKACRAESREMKRNVDMKIEQSRKPQYESKDREDTAVKNEAIKVNRLC